jgi:hypothetical protein
MGERYRPRVVVPGTAIETVGADALKLLMKLQLSNFDRHQFVLVPDSMAEANTIPGWWHHKYRAGGTINTGLLGESSSRRAI